MNCRHCQHWNPEDEQRCRLCGRKLKADANDTTSEWALNVVAGNLAAAPERVPVRRTAEANLSPQRSLFPDRPASKIIPFETRGMSAAAPPAAKTATPRKVVEKQASRPPSPKPASAARNNSLQGEFDLLPQAPITPRTLKTNVEASIYCDAQ